MGRTTQRLEAVDTLGNYFNSLGTVPSQKDYFAAADAPLDYWAIRRLFYSYDRAVKYVLRKYPDAGTQPVSAKAALESVKVKAGAESTTNE